MDITVITLQILSSLHLQSNFDMMCLRYSTLNI